MSAQALSTREKSAVGVIVTAVGVMLVAANLRPAVVAVGPLIGVISDDAGFSSAVAGLLTALPVLFFGISAPVAPRLANRFGIERVIFGALLVLIVGILVRLIPSPAALFGGSAVIGAAIGTCNVVLPALIKRDFAHRSGLMTGLYSMTLSGGAAVASGVSVPINDALGGDWRLALAAWSLLALVAVVVWIPQLPLVHRVTSAAPTSSLLTNPIAWAITVFMGTQSLIFYTFVAWLPQYLVDAGMSPLRAGAVLASAQVVALIMSLVAPIVAGRFAGQRVVTLSVIAVCAVGFVGLLSTDVWPGFWAACVMVGPGSSISLALLFMVLRSSGSEQTGQVSGMAQCVGYLAAAAGPIIIGAIHDVTGSWTLAMAVLGLVLVPQALSVLGAAKDVKMTG
ncbi:MFS transporter [Gordonia hongkongensis]|uniref:MFS transporter n=1 Tax=Gordonia hongkongensis TaxID=1701090 RepID=A0AAX3T710_9ACTN|nr:MULTISPECIES: MFS transporter [Gordonia]QIK46588.1 MFS transporter [Gordonia terrae]MBN0972416.1 MFS transporter [Gordonia sp. BP-119]MBN0982522.1 MFS transporter [Gordonia sp. BP-94]MBR7194148.1 MFS transporter [Gordonia sp. SCSIO 19800]MDF6102412.1 MFS transporter [Gordonia hongkongensis]